MILSLTYPLRIWKSWIYICISIFTIFLVLLPTSILIYLHFQSTIIPENAPLMNLQFQYLENSGPYSFFNMTNSSIDQIKPWKNSNKNSFTKIEQILTIHVKYIKLTKGSSVNGIRLSIYNDKNPPILRREIRKDSLNNKSSWPFKPLSIDNKNFQDNNEFNLYRTDKIFKSWKEVIGKSYTKSIPLLNDNSIKGQTNDEFNNFGLLDYFLPKWILNLFIPRGIQDLFSIQKLLRLLKRKELTFYELNNDNKNLKNFDLLNSFGNFQDLQSNSFSTGFILFEGELNYKDLIGTSLLVELDTNDIFIIESYVKFDYILNGFRWWIYWWPGLSFIIGVSIIWFSTCFGYLLFSWILMVSWNVYKFLVLPESGLNNGLDKDELIKNNLSQLLKKNKY